MWDFLEDHTELGKVFVCPVDHRRELLVLAGKPETDFVSTEG